MLCCQWNDTEFQFPTVMFSRHVFLHHPLDVIVYHLYIRSFSGVTGVQTCALPISGDAGRLGDIAPGQRQGTVESLGRDLHTVLSLSLIHISFGVLLCITVIGIPFGLQHLKLAGLAPVSYTHLHQLILKPKN